MKVSAAFAAVAVLCLCCASLALAQGTADATVGTASADARKHVKPGSAAAKGHAAATPKAENKHMPARVSQSPDATTDSGSGSKKKAPLIEQHSSKPAVADPVNKPADSSSSKSAESTTTPTTPDSSATTKPADSTTTTPDSSSDTDSPSHAKHVRPARRPFTPLSKPQEPTAATNPTPEDAKQATREPVPQATPEPPTATPVTPMFKEFPTSSDILNMVRQKRAEREAKEREEREKHEAILREAKEAIQREIEAKERAEQERKAKEEAEKKAKDEAVRKEVEAIEKEEQQKKAKAEQEKKAKEEEQKKAQEALEQKVKEALEKRVKEELEKKLAQDPKKEKPADKKEDKKEDKKDEHEHDDDEHEHKRERKHDDEEHEREHDDDDEHDHRRGRRGDWDSDWEHKRGHKKYDDNYEKYDKYDKKHDEKYKKKYSREEEEAAALEDIIEAIVGKLFDRGLQLPNFMQILPMPLVVPGDEGIPGPEPKRIPHEQYERPEYNQQYNRHEQYKQDDDRYQQDYHRPGMVQEETAELQIINTGNGHGRGYEPEEIGGGLVWTVTAGADVNYDLTEDKEAWSVQVQQGFKWDHAHGMGPFFSVEGRPEAPRSVRMRGKLGGAVSAAPGVLASTNSISTGGKVPRAFIKHARVSINQPRTCLYRYTPVDAYETVECTGKIVNLSPSLAFDGTFAEFLAVGVHQDLPFMDHVEVECEIMECTTRKTYVDEYNAPYGAKYGYDAYEVKSKVPSGKPSEVSAKVPSQETQKKSRNAIWTPMEAAQ